MQAGRSAAAAVANSSRFMFTAPRGWPWVPRNFPDRHLRPTRPSRRRQKTGLVRLSAAEGARRNGCPVSGQPPGLHPFDSVMGGQHGMPLALAQPENLVADGDDGRLQILSKRRGADSLQRSDGFGRAGPIRAADGASDYTEIGVVLLSGCRRDNCQREERTVIRFRLLPASLLPGSLLSGCLLSACLVVTCAGRAIGQQSAAEQPTAAPPPAVDLQPADRPAAADEPDPHRIVRRTPVGR